MIEVVEAGPAVSVQDLGRPGYAALGVTRSGAADVPALLLANRLVGNDPVAAALEVTLGGLALRALDAVTVALTGAVCPTSADGRAVGAYEPVSLPAGTVLRLGRPPRGLRTYLAVRGGVDVPPILGSRSTDSLSGLGPAPLRPGDRLPVGARAVALPAADPAVAVRAADRPSVRVVPGPRRDWFTDALGQLCAGTYRVTPDSDRVGIRLDGPELTRRRAGELPSEGLVVGAVQVPPDGRPVVFLADHPVTGGYPVPAVVVTGHLPVLAQLRPGDEVRFTS